MRELGFSEEVNIKGLPYLFCGNLPGRNPILGWKVFPLNWPSLLEQVSTLADQPNLSRKDRVRYRICRIYKGSAGIIYASGSQSAESVWINHLKSLTNLLPPDSQYCKASGIGNFLLKNFLALADQRNWPVHLTAGASPLGRLDQQALLAWYAKNGFRSVNADQTDNLMVRAPQQMDDTQVITRFL